MRKITNFLIKYKYIVLVAMIVMTLTSAFLFTKVEINDNMLNYIPEEIESAQGLNLLKENFSDPKTVSLLLKKVSEEEKNVILNEIKKNNEAVVNTDIFQLKDNNYLITIVLSSEENISNVVSSVDKILLDNNKDGGVVSGTVDVTASDDKTLLTIAITFSMITIILFLFSVAYIDAFVVLASVGIAVLLNLGTNLIFGEISKVSFSSAALIQLAVSIDYSLFILTKYREGKNKKLSTNDAISYGMSKGMTSVFAGAFTTIAGFTALLFMKYELGVDLGLVLTKGICISLLCSIILMPIFLSLFHKQLDKKRKKIFDFNFTSLEKFINFKAALIVLIIGVVISGGSYYLKSNVNYTYSEPSISKTKNYVQDNFDLENRLVLIVPTSETGKIEEFTKELMLNEKGLIKEDLTINKIPVASYGVILKNIQNTLSYCSFTPEGNIDQMCAQLPKVTPESIEQVSLSMLEQQNITKDMFINEETGYERILIEINDPLNEKEGEKIFATVENVRKIAKNNFEKSWLTGESALFYDLKDLTTEDSKIVFIITILLIAIVIAITFKSLFVPVLLILIIQSAIWMNVSIAVLGGSSLLFIGYIIVSSVQMGATIDYSILITENYINNRFIKLYSKRKSIINAMNYSMKPVLASALALMSGGFSLALLGEGSVAAIGLLIGRGALMSIVLSLFMLPYLLYAFDKVIKKTKNLLGI